ncbi:MAG: cysteine desulfurase [Oscillospiraceae bacterium]|nr:cysteine desulfurase [Oscillospiraceae bacterium]
MHYLDHAATTPIPKAVADAMYQELTEHFGNPSSQYAMGRAAKERLEQRRGTVARALGCQPKNLHFTSCGTEADNWAISAAVWNGRHTGKHIITTAIEHSAVLEHCKHLAKRGYEVTYLKPDTNGNITAQQVAEALREDTILVSMMLVNNETGVILPVQEVAQLLKAKKSAALLHTDAVQAFMKIPFTAPQLGADFVAISAHKIGGPKGSGALYISDRVRAPLPMLFGGGQESGLRAGTEPTAQIAGFAKAVELRAENLEEKLRHMAEIKAYCLSRLSGIEGLVRVGNGDAPHVLSVSMPGYPSANVVTDLSDQGICISAGSACHKGKPSHVFAALGLEKRVTQGILRISFAPETTREDIDALYEALKKHHDTRFPMF